MNYLRLEGETRKDRIRNTTIRVSLKMDLIIEEIEKINLKWYGHLNRMNRMKERKREALKLDLAVEEDGEVQQRNGNNI